MWVVRVMEKISGIDSLRSKKKVCTYLKEILLKVVPTNVRHVALVEHIAGTTMG